MINELWSLTLLQVSVINLSWSCSSEAWTSLHIFALLNQGMRQRNESISVLPKIPVNISEHHQNNVQTLGMHTKSSLL